MKTLTDFYSEFGLMISDKSNGKVEDDDKKIFLNKALNRLQGKEEFLAIKNRTTVSVYNTVYEYPLADDFKVLEDFYDNKVGLTPGKESDGSYEVNRVSPQDFWRNLRRNDDVAQFAVDGLLGTFTMLFKDIDDGDNQALSISNCESVTDNGTWSGTDDAVNVATDNVVFKEGAGAIRFDVDVSASANDYAGIENSTVSAVDLSDHTQKSTIFAWVYIPSTTNISSFTLRWGSSSSNYWSNTVTTQFSGLPLVSGWNQLGFSWVTATETGSSEDNQIKYLRLQVNYAASMADTTGFRADYIRSAIPRVLDMHFYSTYAVKTAAGVNQNHFVNVSDTTIWEDQYDDALLRLAVADALDTVIEDANKGSIERAKGEADMTQYLWKEPSTEKQMQSDIY